MLDASKVRSFKENLRRIFETLYITKEISRPTRLAFENALKNSRLMKELATQLYGPKREVTFPGEPNFKLVLLSMMEMGGGRFNLLVPQRAIHSASQRRSVRCLAGHRFAQRIQRTLRWNLRHLFELFGIEEEYSGFDGAAVEIIDDLVVMIRTYDFCLFDNLETTKPSKPNVYIEAGMALALRRPFIFCHYKSEVWPSDFSNVNYISYSNYKELFQKLSAVLPIFLAKHVRLSVPPSARTPGLLSRRGVRG